MPSILSKDLRPSRSTLYLLSGITAAGLAYVAYRALSSRSPRSHESDNPESAEKGLLILYATQKGQSKVSVVMLVDNNSPLNKKCLANALLKFSDMMLLCM